MAVGYDGKEIGGYMGVFIDLQEKLHATVGRDRKKVAIGVYPLEKIVLPIARETQRNLESDLSTWQPPPQSAVPYQTQTAPYETPSTPLGIDSKTFILPN